MYKNSFISGKFHLQSQNKNKTNKKINFWKITLKQFQYLKCFYILYLKRDFGLINIYCNCKTHVNLFPNKCFKKEFRHTDHCFLVVSLSAFTYMEWWKKENPRCNTLLVESMGTSSPLCTSCGHSLTLHRWQGGDKVWQICRLFYI